MARTKDVLRAIEKSSLKRKASLRDWLRENHDDFAARLKTRRVDWDVLAKVFVDADLTDARGNPPSAEASRKTWIRVHAEVRAGRPIHPPPSAAPSRAVQQPLPSAAPVPASEFEPGSSRFAGKPAVMRSRLPHKPSED
jgi:hypothetical protein